MAIKVEFETHEHYLLARLHGEWTIPAVERVLHRIASAAHNGKFKRVLLDLIELSAPPNDLARFLAGEIVADAFDPGVRIAAVRRPELLDHFAETVAVNRGAIAIVTADPQEAVQWLLNKATSKL